MPFSNNRPYSAHRHEKLPWTIAGIVQRLVLLAVMSGLLLLGLLLSSASFWTNGQTPWLCLIMLASLASQGQPLLLLLFYSLIIDSFQGLIPGMSALALVSSMLLTKIINRNDPLSENENASAIVLISLLLFFVEQNIWLALTHAPFDWLSLLLSFLASLLFYFPIIWFIKKTMVFFRL
ncbi:MAG: hypothetical protein ACOYK8_01720 [Alphaproteobacteria bacterium]